VIQQRPPYRHRVASYDDVFRALHAARVRYVVVGGTAVVLQGHARLTVDPDSFVDLPEVQRQASRSPQLRRLRRCEVAR
jgi:hypothetical protein